MICTEYVSVWITSYPITGLKQSYAVRVALHCWQPSELQVTRLRDWNPKFCILCALISSVWITSYPITGLKQCFITTTENPKHKVWITSYPITGLKLGSGPNKTGTLESLNYKLPDYGIETTPKRAAASKNFSVWITSYPITGLKQLLGLWLCDISMAGLSELQVTRLRDWNRKAIAELEERGLGPVWITSYPITGLKHNESRSPRCR